MSRVYNFSAGPAVLPEEVLQEAADEMWITEMRHTVMERCTGPSVQVLIKDAEKDLRMS